LPCARTMPVGPTCRHVLPPPLVRTHHTIVTGNMRPCVWLIIRRMRRDPRRSADARPNNGPTETVFVVGSHIAARRDWSVRLPRPRASAGIGARMAARAQSVLRPGGTRMNGRPSSSNIIDAMLAAGAKPGRSGSAADLPGRRCARPGIRPGSGGEDDARNGAGARQTSKPRHGDIA